MPTNRRDDLRGGATDRFDWTGSEWIGRPQGEVLEAHPVDIAEDRPQVGMALRPPAYLRRSFTLERVHESANLFVTAFGSYQVFLNGLRVGDDVLAPGWTDYSKRVNVQQFPVAELLLPGTNVIAAILADGWYAGFVGFDRGHQARLWGDTPQLLARLELDTAPSEGVGTDRTWRRSSGRFVYSDLQMGEMQDARVEPPGWMTANFDDSLWQSVEATPLTDRSVVFGTSESAPIRSVERVAASALSHLGDGSWIVDFGQNLVGTVTLQISGATSGDRIHIRHGEVLAGDGSLYVENLRFALAHDLYICAGDDVEIFTPQFTVHGFRYAHIAGYPGELEGANITANVLHSDVERIGWFDCSDERLNKLDESVDWTVRGNLLDVPTDCPQRDERLGWLGDAGLIMTSATFARDLDGFLAKWTTDIRDAQSVDGAYPDVAPPANVTGDGAPGWADAGAIVPWISYLNYGTKRHLESNYAAICRWIQHLIDSDPDLIRAHRLGHNYGDWLELGVATPKELLASAYLAYSIEVAAHAANALGRAADAGEYHALWDRAKYVFAGRFLDADGRIAGDTQTGYAMALHLDLVPAELRAPSAARLVANIQEVGHLTTGIHGTRFLGPALSDTGNSTIAYDLALSTSAPSWLYQQAHGATTIWERWDGWTENAGFQNPRMNSFNHYALGSVAEWFHRYVAGLSPSRRGPGFRHSVVRPHLDPRLDWARAQRKCGTETLSTRWAREGDQLTLTVNVPHEASSTIYVPRSSGAVDILGGDSIESSDQASAWVRFDAPSGPHAYRSTVDPSWRPTPTLSVDRLDG